jgi:hypothetical protein
MYPSSQTYGSPSDNSFVSKSIGEKQSKMPSGSAQENCSASDRVWIFSFADEVPEL